MVGQPGWDVRMNDGVSWNQVFAVVATLLGVLASALLGMANIRLSGIEKHLGLMNGKLFKHLTDAENHGIGLARLDEKVNSVREMAKVAHTRIDAVEGK